MTEIPTAFHTLSIDHVGPIESKAKGENPAFRFLFVVTDYLTKFTLVTSTISTGASEVAKILLDIIAIFGIPSVIISNRHQSFRSHLLSELFKACL